MNALVLYVGTQAIAYIQNKSSTTSIATITHSSHMDIFQNLAVDLDTEGMLTISFYCCLFLVSIKIQIFNITGVTCSSCSASCSSCSASYRQITDISGFERGENLLQNTYCTL